MLEFYLHFWFLFSLVLSSDSVLKIQVSSIFVWMLFIVLTIMR